MGRFRMKKNPETRLALDFVDEIRCTGSQGTQILNVTKKICKKCQLLDKKLTLGRTIFSNFVSDKNLKSPNWQIPQVALPSTGPRPQKILNQKQKRLLKYKNRHEDFAFCFLKSPTYPICHIFISKKSVDKSGFVDKSGCDKSEEAL